jgi:hypothetical protein
MTDFKKELQELINRHSMENASNTPDFILMAYIQECLDAFNKANAHWYAETPRGLKREAAQREGE